MTRGAETMKTTQELSWLRFNCRVLAQTRRADFPVAERVRFLGIWALNLDEFYAARIGGPFLQERGSDAYRALLEEARAQVRLAEETYAALLPVLEEQGIRIVPVTSLSRGERDFFGAFLAEEVAPRVDVVPGPSIVREVRSQALYLASGRGVLEHLLRLPEAVPRLLEVPGREGTYVRLGELVRSRSDLFLPGGGRDLHEFRVVRLAAVEERPVDWAGLPATLESRLEGPVTHLEVEQGFPAHWTEAIADRARPGARGGGARPPAARPALREPRRGRRPAGPQVPEARGVEGAGLRGRRVRPDRPRRCPRLPPLPELRGGRGVRAAGRRRPAGARHPRHALPRGRRQRARERAHCGRACGEGRLRAPRGPRPVRRAAEPGVEPAVPELGRPRAPPPREEGPRKGDLGARGSTSYVHLGTGNYNTRNGRLYTDFSLFTCNRELTADAKRFFDALEEGTAPAPQHMRTGAAVRDLLVDHLRAEARPGGHAILKFNHLTDPEVLRAAAEAADAGARVNTIVRTTLTEIAPGVHARSIVGRFLEHARIAAFSDGGRWAVYAGSLDAMPRNFDRRYELFFPVRAPDAKAIVLAELRAQLADDVNAFELAPDGGQEARWPGTIDSRRRRSPAAVPVVMASRVHAQNPNTLER